MNDKLLLSAIRERNARIAVIGLGYVGIPVACMFARAGFQVVGIDVRTDKVERINAGRSPIEGKEPGLDDLLSGLVRSGRLRASSEYGACRDANVALISVETPVDVETKRPHYEALRAALRSLGANLRAGTLVVVESTIAPRTMSDVVKAVLEETSGLSAGTDFQLLHCPERLMPGKLLQNIETMNRVVGGMTPEATELGLALYGHIVRGQLDPTDCLTAELVKTTENAYRDVQIAFANEVALICEAVGGDVWKLRELVNKSPGRNVLLPGGGVGGHCIPKDPWLLVAGAGEASPRLIPAARRVNDGMPLHVAELALEALEGSGRAVKESSVAILGYAYLENSDDTRNSPSEALIARLKERGAEVAVHDPHVPELSGGFEGKLAGTDCIVVMVGHDEYRSLDWGALRPLVRTPNIIDARGAIDLGGASAAGFLPRLLGTAVRTNRT